ncbi:MAG TPA: PQ-loop repeat-containing protein [Gaiellaceae bacterium]
MFEVLGVAGIAISMLAYLPQVVHLAKEHCSAGVSSRAWTMWLVSSVLIGALAVHRHDAVFILLQVSSLASAAAILVLGHRYRGLVCETHLHTLAEQWPVAAVDGSQGRVAGRR